MNWVAMLRACDSLTGAAQAVVMASRHIIVMILFRFFSIKIIYLEVLLLGRMD